MLSVFPDFLFVGAAFSPLVIRLILAVSVGILASYHAGRGRGALIHSIEKFSFLKTQTLLVQRVSVTVEVILSLLFLVGLFTQIAALISALFFLKILWYKRSNPEFAPEGANFYWLLFVLSILALFSGAGPYAFDIPL